MRTRDEGSGTAATAEVPSRRIVPKPLGMPLSVGTAFTNVNVPEGSPDPAKGTMRIVALVRPSNSGNDDRSIEAISGVVLMDESVKIVVKTPNPPVSI